MCRWQPRPQGSTLWPGGGGKQGALWEMCKWRIVKTDLSTEAQVPTPQYGQYFTHAHNHITPVMSHGQL